MVTLDTDQILAIVLACLSLGVLAGFYIGIEVRKDADAKSDSDL